MKKWEHKSERWASMSFSNVINTNSNTGWELVAVTADPHMKDSFYFFWKRRVK